MWSSTKHRRQVAFCIALLAAFAAIGLSSARSGDDGKEDLQVIVDEAKRRAAERPVTVKPGKFSDQKRVEAAAATGRERGREELERRAKAVQEADGAAEPSGSAPLSVKAIKVDVPGRVVVALSSSMPEQMLREYMRQLHEVPEGVVVLRGFVGGARTVAPTGRWVESIRRRQASCRECAHYQVEILVDPLVYRMLDIKQVPAVAYLPGVRDLRHCDAEVLSTSSVAYGAVSIGAALKRLQKDGVPVPREVVEKFGGA